MPCVLMTRMNNHGLRRMTSAKDSTGRLSPTLPENLILTFRPEIERQVVFGRAKEESTCRPPRLHPASTDRVAAHEALDVWRCAGQSCSMSWCQSSLCCAQSTDAVAGTAKDRRRHGQTSDYGGDDSILVSLLMPLVRSTLPLPPAPHLAATRFSLSSDRPKPEVLGYGRVRLSAVFGHSYPFTETPEDWSTAIILALASGYPRFCA